MIGRTLSALSAAALVALASVSISAQQQGPPVAQATPKATPRAADGHPDLSGIWIAGNRSIRTDESKSVQVILPLEGIDRNKDNVFAALDRISVTERDKDANKPPYKPE